MKLSQANLDQYGALYTIFNNQGIGVEECESMNDIEVPLYELIGNEWSITGNTYAGPFETVDELLKKCPELKNLNFTNKIKFH